MTAWPGVSNVRLMRPVVWETTGHTGEMNVSGVLTPLTAGSRPASQDVTPSYP